MFMVCFVFFLSFGNTTALFTTETLAGSGLSAASEAISAMVPPGSVDSHKRSTHVRVREKLDVDDDRDSSNLEFSPVLSPTHMSTLQGLTVRCTQYISGVLWTNNLSLPPSSAHTHQCLYPSSPQPKPWKDRALYQVAFRREYLAILVYTLSHLVRPNASSWLA